jgi:hypothetical protein
MKRVFIALALVGVNLTRRLKFLSCFVVSALSPYGLIARGNREMLQMVMHVVQWLRKSPTNLGKINHQEQYGIGAEGKNKLLTFISVPASRRSMAIQTLVEYTAHRKCIPMSQGAFKGSC